jgi:hypothetical protein
METRINYVENRDLRAYPQVKWAYSLNKAWFDMGRTLFGLIFLAITGTVALGVGCQKTYTLTPLPVPTNTYTPSPTPTCYGPFGTQSCSNGIMWDDGQLIFNNNNGSLSGTIELFLAVNCAPTASSQVTLTAPGLTVPLINYGSVGSYSDFWFGGLPNMTPGTIYTLTSVTPIGTATAAVTAAPIPAISTDGLTVSWTSSSMFTIAYVQNLSSQTTYSPNLCWSISSPWAIPAATAYPASGAYTVSASTLNYTTNIQGGKGMFYAESENHELVIK